jgi:ATP-dependent Lon protease
MITSLVAREEVAKIDSKTALEKLNIACNYLTPIYTRIA